MSFPYKEKSPPENWEGWHKLKRDDLTAKEVKALMAEISRLNLESISQSLVQKLASSPEFKAICLIKSGAWGYEFQDEIIQLEDGKFLHQSWNDNTNLVEQKSLSEIDLDLQAEITHLRGEGLYIQNSGENKNPELKSGLELGRGSTIFLAVDNDFEWLTWPKPGNGIYKNCAPNRIFKAIFDEKIGMQLE